ncbi:MAG: hypothetical protein GC147_08190 [Porphyrobacter sp.]|nr:hypothetical protein [Porphyrobacter sp.]
MAMVLDPASLGGLAGLIALAGWALGQMHGRAAAGPCTAAQPQTGATGSPTKERRSPPAEAPASDDGASLPQEDSPCQERARAERLAILARPVALAELHAQVTRIRRDERVLTAASDEDALIALPQAGGEPCRYLGRSGQPTCPGPLGAACIGHGSCGAYTQSASLCVPPQAPRAEARPQSVSPARSCRP